MTTTTTHTIMPSFLVEDGELPLAVPPISPKRALDAAADKANSWKKEDGSFNGISLPAIANPYQNLDYLRTLERGGCLFSFSCHNRNRLTPYEVEMVDTIINLSTFKDEVKDNYVPPFDIYTYEDATDEEEKTEKEAPQLTLNEFSLFGIEIPQEPPQVEPEVPYSFLLARAAYLLVGVDSQALLGEEEGPTLLSSFNYHDSCQPTGTKVWTDYQKMDPHNFRITKPVIPRVYDLTVQFRVSSLANSPEELKRLGRHVGTRVDGGILLERTKRSKPPKEDATKKAKSVLLYTDLGGGVILVTHLTVVLQRGLPGPVERLIHYLPNKFQSWGLGETCETAWKTRKFLKMHVPYEAVTSEEGLEFEEEEQFLDALEEHDKTMPTSPADPLGLALASKWVTD